MKTRCKDFKNYNLIFFVFFSIRDQSVLVIEDLSEKGFKSKDWFKYKLNHQEVLLSLTELAKFHACGLAYRLIIFRESFCSPFYQKHWHFFLHFGTFSRRYCKYFLLKRIKRFVSGNVLLWSQFFFLLLEETLFKSFFMSIFLNHDFIILPKSGH